MVAAVTPTLQHAKDRATVALPSGVLATLVYVSGPKGRSAKIVVGGRHFMVDKHRLRVVEPSVLWGETQ